MIRGVGPENPNMRGAKLQGALESLGFTNVKPVITSGNVVFTSKITDTAKLERMIEVAFPKLLNFERDVFVRSQAELQQLVDANPFPGITQSPKDYITVTFFKSQPKDIPKLPYTPEGKAYTFLKLYDRALTATLDQTSAKSPDMMAQLAKLFGKQITTRTWKTVNRLLDKLSSY